MQNLFGICNGAHHIDVLQEEFLNRETYQMILRVAPEALDYLRQTLGTISTYQDRRCTFQVLTTSPILSLL